MRRLRLTLLSIPILLFISLAATFIAATRHETVLTDETRASLPGSYVRLSSGTVRYDWHGPSDGPVVVLIHGFSTPSFVFQRNVPAMVKAGFRVLTYDHFGRGYSDRPDAVYDENFYDRELLEILNAQNVKEPVSVLGYSLGGGIAAVFAARHPDRVKKLMLVAPVGYMPPASGSTRLLRVPVLGEWLFAVIGKSSMIKEFETERAQGIATEEMVRLYAEQFSYHGYRNALLSTVRHFPFSTLSKEY
ncbi:MAG: alpha/beta fold hydrolase, partial [Spirochaetia bacterium]|nr:alpha/beta fold hydrolase [Spirochaetia bacterium]